MNPTTAAAKSPNGKFLLLRALRAAGLLRVADGCKFVLSRASAAAANRRFLARHPGFAVPPAHLAFDALNHVDWERYLASGLQHAGVFARVIQARVPASGPVAVLEWGCGPGRLIRHLPGLLAAALPGRELRVTGADYNPESIAWCRAYLPGLHFVENQLQPPLPLANASVDVVYNFSVFTHLSQPMQQAWAVELQRVLKPGGWLIATTHGDAYRHLLASADERAAYAAGQGVDQSGYREGRKWFLAMHPPAYVRQQLLAGWDAVEQLPTRPEDDMLQDLWAARKPSKPDNGPT